MNKLAQETSPYLLQHADNPVNWYPWGEQALTLAKELNKPILLSIGYSACHWCHVMAHESFEDKATANLMNELFVNIKVDREERPDLDKLYQVAHQMLTQRGGGWPLTMFLTPDDQMPFFAGTYFPGKARHQLPSFKDILKRVSGLYQERQEDIQKQNESLASALQNIYNPPASGQILTSAPLDQVRVDIQRQYDAERGGFGIAPKFPHTPFIERLMRHGDAKGLTMAVHTLEKMAHGGMNDQLGGGFCRYSTDDDWMIPHFEKMLYDNASLLAAYIHADGISQNPLFKRISHETACWVMRDMQSEEGGYFSSFDADSLDEKGHAHEGLFYTWTPEKVSAVLEADEYAVFARRFGLDRNPNFENHWHLHVFVSIDELVTEFKQSKAAIAGLLDSARAKLLAVRNQRNWPARDEKILTSWNALMIRGMALAARFLDDDAYARSATLAVDFIRHTLWQNGQLLATYKDGKAHLNAYLDDYAFLLDALLELLQVRWRQEDIVFAQQLADVLLDQFEDKDKGGFWFVSHEHEALIQRPKTYTDDAIPNGNGVAVFALQRLGYLLGEPRYLEAAERALKNAATGLNQAPSAHCTLLKGLEEYLHAPETIIIRGDQLALSKLQADLNQRYYPRRQCYLIPENEKDLHPALKEKVAAESVLAYRCEGETCHPPLIGRERILAELS